MFPGLRPILFSASTPGAGEGGGGEADGVSLAITGAGIPTAGRIVFYYDIVESQDATGPVTHRFRIARWFGSSGAASVDYQSFGDSHINVSGTLNWADDDNSILYVDVTVSAANLSSHSSSGLGEHRIYLQLSSPTGATLHNDVYTRAYGIIDDSFNSDGTVNGAATMVASNANAVFFDADAVSNGDGTQSSPYNNVFDAITNVGTKRYIYGDGTQVIDGTDIGGPNGASYQIIDAPSARAGETTRLIIRNWPGRPKLVIDGNADTNTAGFFSNGTGSYHTYRGISFTDLDTSGSTGAGGFGIWYHYGTDVANTVEYCDFNDLDGPSGSNTGGVNFYDHDGCKVWRCTFADIKVAGSNTNGNTSGVFSFNNTLNLLGGLSVQRCEFESTMASCVYDKRTSQGSTTTNLRHSIIRGNTAHFGAITDGHKGVLITNNLFTSQESYVLHRTSVNDNYQTDNQVSNNYFYLSGNSDQGAIYCRQMADASVFGNIFDGTSGAFSDFDGVNGVPRYLDYNVTNGVAGDDWEISGTNYATSATVNASFASFCANDVEGDPAPNNVVGEDVTLGVSSVAVSASIGGTDAGCYLSETFDVLGA